MAGKKVKHGQRMPLVLLTNEFILFLVLATAYALTVETPIKEVQVARGNNATLRCNFNTNIATNAGDFVVWKKILSAVNQVALKQTTYDRASRREVGGEMEAGQWERVLEGKDPFKTFLSLRPMQLETLMVDSI